MSYLPGVLSENDLLAWIAAGNARLPGSVTIPPGDDMGAMRVGELELLVAVDAVVEGVHFSWGSATAEQVGRKAMNRNLSDVAAMGATPVGAVAAAQLNRGLSQGQAEGITEGLRLAGERFGCPVVGGDVSVVDGPTSVSVTVWATMAAGVPAIRRRTASVGDAVWVSGVLGGSVDEDGSGWHLDFEPRVALGQKLAGGVPGVGGRATSMMDVSDGLAMDVPRLVEHARIELARLPMRAGVTDWRQAVGDGEDYELVFTARPSIELPSEVDGVRLTRIGEVTDGGCVVFVDERGAALDASGLGWEHGG